MKLVLTQPIELSNRLATQLRARGCNAVLLPLVRTEALFLDERTVAFQLERADVVICTSPAVVPLLPSELPAMTSQRWYAVGSGSAKLLEQKYTTMSVAFPREQHSAEALAKLMENVELAGKHVLIVGGVGGRKYLDYWLADQRACVHRLELYQRQDVCWSREKMTSLQSLPWLVTSGENLERLAKTGITPVLLVTSKRLFQLARDKGYNAKLVRGNKTEDIVALLAE